MDIPGIDMPHPELVTALVLLATNLIISTLKACNLELSPNGWLRVNGFVSACVGGGVAAIADGEPLPRVILWAVTTGVAALSSVAVHHAGATVRAGRQALRTMAANGTPPSGPPDDEAEECDSP